MQLGDIGRDHLALGVSPRTRSDTIARIHRSCSLCAEIRVPRAAAASDARRDHLAVRVRAGQAAQVGAVSLARAGDEETHRRRSSLALAVSFALAIFRLSKSSGA